MMGEEHLVGGIITEVQIMDDIRNTITRYRKCSIAPFGITTIITGGIDNSDFISTVLREEKYPFRYSDPRNLTIDMQLARINANAMANRHCQNTLTMLRRREEDTEEIIEDKAIVNRRKLNHIESLNSRTRNNVRWR